MIREGLVEVEGGKVWYDMFVEHQCETAIPLLILHGGPGSSHVSMTALGSLHNERPVIFYDQLGCGKSDRPTDASLWRIDRFVRELAQLRSALELDEVHILGHSWGTMLLADYLLTEPIGVASAIFSSPCLSAIRWMEDAMRYRRDLPEEVQATLNDCEAQGTTDSAAYQEASEVYAKRHVCRIERPQALRDQQMAAFGKEVYNTMWGPSEFYATGNLRHYDRTDRLQEIKVSSLFTCGHFDEASPASTKYYQSLVPDAQFHEFNRSAHMPIYEQPEEYLSVVRAFLRSVEQR